MRAKGHKNTSKSKEQVRNFPVGAELVPGGTHFRVWAPRREQVILVLEEKRKKIQNKVFSLTPEREGYFSGLVPQAKAGALYRFQFNNSPHLFPDPASRFQPYGPSGPSQVIDPLKYKWTARNWNGLRLQGQVIYEMHIGTFTRSGTWKAAAEHIEELADLGITLLEIMPINEFHGRFGWGYDGVHLFAPYHYYGTPDDFRAFVDKAHGVGLGVVLDVVYNHFGPVGNYMSEFSFDYFTDRYETEWGYAINFDGSKSGPVREFFIANAGYWMEEFHLDGLRLDATQSIYDQSSEHIIAEITRSARSKAQRRPIVVIAENEPQNFRLLQKIKHGGFGVDGVWNDDFHHSAAVALTGRTEAYYMDYLGSPQELISAAKWGYLFQGQFYTWQNKCRGTPVLEFAPSCFVNFLQNHDQVANSARGQRIQLLTHPAKFRALTAFFLLIPGTPMLFQGQEFCASSPFFYFADISGELAQAVREGRLKFMKQFRSFSDQKVRDLLANPLDISTFRRCKLDHSERETHQWAYLLHRDLLRLRREDEVFRAQRTDWMHGAVIGPQALILRFLGAEKGDRLIMVNLGTDHLLVPAPEPLLAPPTNSHWEMLWSSEAVPYGGNGTPAMEPEGEWLAPGNATVVFAPKKVVRLQYA